MSSKATSSRRTASGWAATPPGIGRIPVRDLRPAVDGGRRPAKAVVGETFPATATVFREGHDAVAANVVLRGPGGRRGPWTPMRELAPGSDEWGAEVTPDAPGRWTFAVEAWSDPVGTWRHHARIKVPAGIDVGVVLEEGAELHERAAKAVPKSRGRTLVLKAARTLGDDTLPVPDRLEAAFAPEVDAVLARYPLRELVTACEPLPLLVERERALFGSWYEFFPRSEGTPEQPHGTFRTAARRLPAIAVMGFDVVYLPPVHPIGTTFRKGRNNTLDPTPAPLLTRLNDIRRGHPALHHLRNLRFHHADNDSVIVYSKRSGTDTVIVVVSLDPHHTQEATVSLDMPQLGLDHGAFLSVHDELTDETYTWGKDNYVCLEPGSKPAHVFHVR